MRSLLQGPERAGAWHTMTVPPPSKLPDNPAKALDAVPERLLVEWSFKLYAMCALGWDYVETLCDQCIIMRLNATKPLVRKIRELKRSYEQFRSCVMTQEASDNEMEHALNFEEYVRDDFNKLMNAVEPEVNKLDLLPDHRLLVMAVHKALAVMEAVKQYAQWCDRQIASYGVWVCDCCMVQTEFLQLYPLIPLFAGDCYQPDIEGRRLTASILVNRIMKMGLDEILLPGEVVCKE